MIGMEKELNFPLGMVRLFQLMKAVVLLDTMNMVDMIQKTLVLLFEEVFLT